MAGAIWAETIRTPSQFQSMIFPRVLAVAERSWHREAWEDQRNKLHRNRMKKASWEKFANTLGYKELARLDKLGINYHIPVPGARYNFLFAFKNSKISRIQVQLNLYERSLSKATTTFLGRSDQQWLIAVA